MPSVREMEYIVQNVFSSYEARIQSIESIFDATHQILKDFQEPFFDTKQERESINAQLREHLARNESLRKKDFDNMMQGILSIQDEREKEVRNLLNSYLNGQKQMAKALKNNLGKFKDSLARGEVQRVKEFQALIKEDLSSLEERKKEAISQLKDFQEEQNVLAARLKELLAKGRELRIRDFKSMLKEFEAQHKERLARQGERKKEVRHLLGKLKKEREEAAKNWRAMQIELAFRRALSHKGANTGVQKQDVKE